jgi:outer membrane receptor protein involved in Fe transport
MRRAGIIGLVSYCLCGQTIPPVYTSITVTATRSTEEEAARTPQRVAVLEQESLRSRPLPTIGTVLDRSAGILIQQSTTAQVSPFLRGLTGYHVLNLLDGVRFNNSTFRSGPNQYLAWMEPSQARQVDAMLGPAGALYGSDALGGTIQVFTAEPQFSDPGAREWRSDGGLFAGSADRSVGGDARLQFGTARAWLLFGGSARSYDDLRAGRGADSRHALRRYFGLDNSMIRHLLGSRMLGSGFAQQGAHAKFALRRTELESFSVWCQFGEQTGVESYKDLWGGLGRLQSRFDPQRLRFAYARYERLKAGWFDSLSGTFSVNSQADGSVRQGLLASNAVIMDDSRVDAYGYTAQGAKSGGNGRSLVFGAEIYDEHVKSARASNGALERPLYPDGSRYRTAAGFAQASTDLLRSRLRAIGGIRFTRIAFSTRESLRFGTPAATQGFHDTTFHASLTWRASERLRLHALGSRGFRAPNLNDLGAIGLNDLGYEIPASEAAGALMGASAGEGALPSGRNVARLKAESLWNNEVGAAWHSSRLLVRVQAFLADLIDPIVRRTLLFPASSIPSRLAGLPVTPVPQTEAQRAAGVAGVATSLDPRAVKAFVNDGESRYQGVESLAAFTLAPGWRIEGGYHFLAGRDLHPNRNIRRLPPQAGYVALRWMPTGRKPWIEISAQANGPQRRLSGGDIDDERIGASRSRRDIASFFASARVAPWITPDGRFAPSGETLRQIQDRVLPGVVETVRVPLYAQTSGWVAMNVRAGFPLSDTLTLSGALENFADRNYRAHGSGVDAPGINAWAGIRWSF